MRKAFTLAETLITLAIIGIVAAITIPSLMNKTQDQELKSAWKKQYSTLANAFYLILSENGGNIKGLCSDDACLLNLFKDKLIVQKSCPTNAQTNCYVPSSTIKTLANVEANNAITSLNSGLVLSDGSVLISHFKDVTCNYHLYFSTSKKTCGSIFVDVNGKRKPNTQGKDIFQVMIDENKMWPAGSENDDIYLDRGDHDCGTTYTEATYAGLGCSAKYLYE